MGCIAAQWVNYEIDFTYISNNMKLASTKLVELNWQFLDFDRFDNSTHNFIAINGQLI
jgi:hypothetical protein